ncbi:MAG: hypothetical protein HY092_01435 [Candidatus Kerfeldbacteria bacterium]|nr:hypothetical protein [Candidatus Kerfeldbacteria bacterium]
MAEQEIPRGAVLLEWTFPEFETYDRNRRWYIGFLAIIAALIVYGVWSKGYTFIVLVILAAVIIVVRLRRSPLDVHVAIREEGLEVSSRFYAWRELKEFWILYRPPAMKKLYLHFKAAIRPELILPLENQNPLKVRQYLSEHLVENIELEEEPGDDQLARMLKI